MPTTHKLVEIKVNPHSKVKVYGYDERQYAENFLDILVFQLDCSMPFVWIPNNQTSYVKWEAIPRNWRSKAFQTQGPNSVENFRILLA